MDNTQKLMSRWGEKRLTVFNNLNKVLGATYPIFDSKYNGKLNFFHLDSFDELNPSDMKGSISYYILREDSDGKEREYSIIISYDWEDLYLYNISVYDAYGVIIMQQEYEPIGDDVDEIRNFANDFVNDLEDMITNKASESLVRRAEKDMEYSKKVRMIEGISQFVKEEVDKQLKLKRKKENEDRFNSDSRWLYSHH